MEVFIRVAACLAVSAMSATANEPLTVPKGPPPEFLTAQIAGKEGNQVTFTKYSFGANQLEKEGKKVWEHKTYSVTSPPKPIGKDVRAYGVAGKPIEAAALAKLLAKPVTVLVYYADPGNPGPPDLFYLRPFKEGTVALVVSCDLFEVPGAPQPTPTRPQPKK